MTETGPRLDRRGQAALRAERQRLWAQSGPETGAWHAGSSLLSGVLVLGGAGWLLERWLGWPWLVPVGVLAGTAAGMASLWFRYGVARLPQGRPPEGATGGAPQRRPGHPDHHPTDDRSPMEDAP